MSTHCNTAVWTNLSASQGFQNEYNCSNYIKYNYALHIASALDYTTINQSILKDTSGLQLKHMIQTHDCKLITISNYADMGPSTFEST